MNTFKTISQKFVQLSADKQKLVYNKLTADGMSVQQFPIVPYALSYDGLSHAQARQWFLWQMDKQSSAYHMAGALDIEGDLDVARVEQVFSMLLERHHALRCNFYQDTDGRARVCVHDRVNFALETLTINDNATEQQINTAISQWINQPFDLTNDLLFKASIIQTTDKHYILVVNMHHIVSDGWSIDVILREFMQLYQVIINNQQITLPTNEINYSDYALWQKQWLKAGEEQRQLAFWLEKLGQSSAVASVPTDFDRPPSTRLSSQTIQRHISVDQVNNWRKFVTEQNTTLFTLLMASLQVLLYKLSNEPYVRVGVPVSGRDRVETHNLVGIFVNTQVIADTITPNLTLQAVFKQCKQTLLQAQHNQDLPFEKLVDAISPYRSMGENPLFQLMCNYLVLQDFSTISLDTISIAERVIKPSDAQFDLVFNLKDYHDSGLTIEVIYADSLFKISTIDKFINDFIKIVEQMIAKPSQRVGNITINDHKSNKVHYVIDPTTANTSKQLLPYVIAKQAQIRPNDIAFIYQDQTISYTQFEQRANYLAKNLIDKGVTTESKVVVTLERSIELFIALYAVYKAGGAYIPIDPDYPQGRINYIINDSQAEYIISDEQIYNNLNTDKIFININNLDNYCTTTHELTQTIQQPLHNNQLAYIIYTSGSTGNPKGVAVNHAPLAMHCQHIAQCYEITANDNEFHFLSISFDGSHERWLTPISQGARVIIRPQELQSIEHTCKYMMAHKVSIVALPPSYIRQLVAWVEDQQNNNQLTNGLGIKTYCFAGEAFSRQQLHHAINVLKPQQIINGYGPTETVITPTLWRVQADTADFSSSYAPIGQLVGEREGYIVDSDLNIVPQGIAGELYLGGRGEIDGLARGYQGKFAETAERFIANPFANNGSRLYRTGDLVRLNNDGQLEYLGRIDQQVKIRGYRIELGEIEKQLVACDNVKQAVVIANKNNDNQQLIAYLVLHDKQTDTNFINQLQQQLSEILPCYMIPHHYIVLDKLPLNPNGKIDLKALPQPTMSSNKEFIEPQGEIETTLASIWQEVLGIDTVGRYDNFFQLGGDSIIGLQIVSKLQQHGLHISPKNLFEHQSLSALARVVTSAKVALRESITSGNLPLLPIQSDFFATATRHYHHYNQAILIDIGTQDNISQFQQDITIALQAVIYHHDSLRISYHQDDNGTWQQNYNPFTEQTLKQIKQAINHSIINGNQIVDHDIEEICNEVQQSFSLDNGLLLRTHIIETANGCRLLFVAHHLIIDGVSWRVLLHDFMMAYQQVQTASDTLNYKDISLLAKTSSYADWSLALQADTATLFADDINHWQGFINDNNPPICDNADGSNTQADMINKTISLDNNYTDKLLTHAPHAYRTQVNDLLLTAVAYAFAFDNKHIIIDLESHGRGDLYDDIDLSRTIGWFTSLYPVRLTACHDIATSIKTNKERLRSVPHNGLSFGALMQFGNADQQAVIRQITPRKVIFNYLGQLDVGMADNPYQWQMASESVGQSISDDMPIRHDIAINGGVQNSRLQLTFSYSDKRFASETIDTIIDTFTTALYDIINHCCSGVYGVTPSDFPLTNISQKQLDNLPININYLDNLYPLAPMQQGMLFHSLFDNNNNNYINQMRVDIYNLQTDKFKNAWQQVIDRHDIMRTAFIIDNDPPLQWVTNSYDLQWLDKDISHLSQAEQTTELDNIATDQYRAFDFSKPSLTRFALIKINKNTHHFIWTLHHILLDGWSSSRLMAEVMQVYSGVDLPTNTYDFKDYIQWLSSQNRTQAEHYWQGQLTALTETSYMVGSLAKPSQVSHNYHSQQWTFDSKHLAQRAKDHQLTINTCFQGAIAVLMSRYCYKQSVCFGATVAGRPSDLPHSEQIIGLFINTLPMVVNVDGAKKVNQWLQELQQLNINNREYEYLPLNDIQKLADCHSQGTAIFDTLVVFENYPVDQVLKQAKVGETYFDNLHNHEQNNYPLTFLVSVGESLHVTCQYNGEYFSQWQIRQLLQHLEYIISQLLADNVDYKQKR